MLKVIMIVSIFMNGQAAGVYEQADDLLPGFETMTQCETAAKEARTTIVPPYAKAQIVCVSETEVKVIE